MCISKPILSCNVSEALIYMWQNTWESDSRRPRHPKALDDLELLAIEGSKKSPKTPRTQLHEEESEKSRKYEAVNTANKPFTAANNSHRRCR